MANFLLVYTCGGMPATDADRKQSMDALEAWFGHLGDNIVDMGNPGFGAGRGCELRPAHSRSVSVTRLVLMSLPCAGDR